LQRACRVRHVLCVFMGPQPPEIDTLSLHDALPICSAGGGVWKLTIRPRSCGVLSTISAVSFSTSLLSLLIVMLANMLGCVVRPRSEEHTSELQSRENLVCRLLLEKKKEEPTLERSH